MAEYMVLAFQDSMLQILQTHYQLTLILACEDRLTLLNSKKGIDSFSAVDFHSSPLKCSSWLFVDETV